MAQALTHVISFKDWKVRVYARRFLANRLNRSVRAIKQWQQRRVIPFPLLSLNPMSAWYTFDELKIYERADSLDQIRRGVAMDGSLFSDTALAEITTLRERLAVEGPTILSPGLDVAEVLAELNTIRATMDWRCKPDRGRKKRKEKRLFVRGED